MHGGEIETGSRLVRRLLRHQFPHWADLPIEMSPARAGEAASPYAGPSRQSIARARPAGIRYW
jgi:hypothetical protein